MLTLYHKFQFTGNISKGPAYRPSSLEARTKSDLICRFHDMYITTIQVWPILNEQEKMFFFPSLFSARACVCPSPSAV